MKKTNDLGKDSMLALIIRLAVPSMLAQLVNVLYSIVDRMYIGNIPLVGDVALAGVGVCGPIVALLTSFSTLIGIGGSILMAMKMGEGDNKEAEKILSNSFSFLVIFAVVLTIIFISIKGQLLVWFGASDITFKYADTYLTIYTIGTIFAMLALGLNTFISCQGFATFAMLSVVAGAVSNIILDSAFIFWFKWGIAGAAIATVISQAISCALVLSFLFGKKIHIKITKHKLSFTILKNILSIGVSPFIILATDSVIIIVMNTILQHYGGAGQGDLLISSATIVQSYMLLITGPLLGITGGTQAVISYNYGARNIERVKKAEKYVIITAVTYCSIMFVISRLLPQYFVLMFTSSPDTVALSIWGIKVYTLGIIPMAFQYSVVDCLTALGKTKLALSMSLFRKILYIIFTIMLPMFFMATSAFYAEPLVDVICGIINTTIFLLVFNKFLNQRKLTS